MSESLSSLRHDFQEPEKASTPRAFSGIRTWVVLATGALSVSLSACQLPGRQRTPHRGAVADVTSQHLARFSQDADRVSHEQSVELHFVNHRRWELRRNELQVAVNIARNDHRNAENELRSYHSNDLLDHSSTQYQREYRRFQAAVERAHGLLRTAEQTLTDHQDQEPHLPFQLRQRTDSGFSNLSHLETFRGTLTAGTNPLVLAELERPTAGRGYEIDMNSLDTSLHGKLTINSDHQLVIPAGQSISEGINIRFQIFRVQGAGTGRNIQAVTNLRFTTHPDTTPVAPTFANGTNTNHFFSETPGAIVAGVQDMTIASVNTQTNMRLSVVPGAPTNLPTGLEYDASKNAFVLRAGKSLDLPTNPTTFQAQLQAAEVDGSSPAAIQTVTLHLHSPTPPNAALLIGSALSTSLVEPVAGRSADTIVGELVDQPSVAYSLDAVSMGGTAVSGHHFELRGRQIVIDKAQTMAPGTYTLTINARRQTMTQASTIQVIVSPQPPATLPITVVGGDLNPNLNGPLRADEVITTVNAQNTGVPYALRLIDQGSGTDVSHLIEVRNGTEVTVKAGETLRVGAYELNITATSGASTQTQRLIVTVN